jgi:4-hydroxy-4-methyl-2-oxoglutarate aldolase
MTAFPGQNVLAALQRHSTPAVANAIETFGVRLRNEGFADASIRRMLPRSVPLVGHAVTVRIRCSNPPKDQHAYVDRTDWWNHLRTIPEPRVVVIEDVDDRPGTGAFVGEVHANILLALGCAGAITNGAARDLPALESTGFHLFAGSVAVSHAYSHIVDFGLPVEIGGLRIEPGDLLHADVHGVLTVPREIAARVPAVADEIVQRELRVLEYCRSRDFSVAGLRDAVKGVFH